MSIDMDKLVERTVTDYFKSLAEGFDFAAEGSDDGMADVVGAIADKYAMVDMGLPSGILWAKWNLGADRDNPHGGGYYQWAATEPISGWVVNVESPYECAGRYGTYSYEKYNEDDKLARLTPEDDAATRHCPKWRMPTYADVNELLANVDVKQVDDFEGMGAGYLLTPKSAAPNDTERRLFFPLDGAIDSTGMFVEHAAICWMSNHSPYQTPHIKSWAFMFKGGHLWRTQDFRQHALQIRPVMDNPEKK